MRSFDSFLDPREIFRSVISTTPRSYCIRHEHCRVPCYPGCHQLEPTSSIHSFGAETCSSTEPASARNCTNGCFFGVALKIAGSHRRLYAVIESVVFALGPGTLLEL
ncbi:uncharacterized protein BDV17DRAFT_263346 [Aspergillus undulatus]|uniref:uncharacterized protein n=1 Tax=Aspergillus undulatus TaxID=1810928 RepID=UPI003CCD5F95